MIDWVLFSTPLFKLRRSNFDKPDVVESFDASIDPDSQSRSIGPVPSLKKALHLYGAAVRREVLLPRERSILLSHNQEYVQLEQAEDLYELCLFLFSEKDWQGLAQHLPRTALALHSMNAEVHQAIIADLIYLTAHRLSFQGAQDLAGGLERFARQYRYRLAPAQASLHAAFDEFLTKGVHASRTPIAEACKHYTPRFALRGAVTLMSPKDTAQLGKRSRTHCARDAYRTEYTTKSTLHLIRTSENRDVVLVGIDEGYFERYFNLFLEGFLSKDLPYGLHLHCIGFEPDPGRIPNHIGLSTEPSPNVSTRGTDYAKAYFASARYIHLAQFLDLYDEIKLTDIDGVILDNIRQRHQEPVVLHSRVEQLSGKRLPFEVINAGNVSFRSSREAKAFALYLRDYLIQAFNSDRRHLWYIDQSALFCAWQDLKDCIPIATDKRAIFQDGGNWNYASGVTQKLEKMERALKIVDQQTAS